MQALLVPLFFARKKAGKRKCRVEADLDAKQEQEVSDSPIFIQTPYFIWYPRAAPGFSKADLGLPPV